MAESLLYVVPNVIRKLEKILIMSADSRGIRVSALIFLYNYKCKGYTNNYGIFSEDCSCFQVLSVLNLSQSGLNPKRGGHCSEIHF